jgi:His-Xaa-Ser system protein HxsD
MEWFLNKEINWDKFELIIDKNIFNKDIVLKASYNFLDKWYFFFKLDAKWNILLQFTPKEWVKDKPEIIIWEFSDELLAVYLRNKLEKDNKNIREKIVWAAIANSIDTKWFVELNTDINNDGDNQNNNQIDFDKDIDEILKEIENDPDLKIDEEEIERILKEIEEETENESKNKEIEIKLDTKAVKEQKKKFKK